MNTIAPGPRASKTGLNAAVAATLNGERVARGMTFDDLSAASGIPVRSLKRYLSAASRDITLPTLGTLAVALDLSTTEIMRRAGLRQPATTAADEVDATAARIVEQARAEAAAAEVEETPAPAQERKRRSRGA